MLGLGYPTLSCAVLETTRVLSLLGKLATNSATAAEKLSHVCITNSNFRKIYVHRVKQGVETINFSKISISWTGLKQSTQFAALGRRPAHPDSRESLLWEISCDVRSQLQRFPSTLGQPSPEQPASASMGPGEVGS